MFLGIRTLQTHFIENVHIASTLIQLYGELIDRTLSFYVSYFMSRLKKMAGLKRTSSICIVLATVNSDLSEAVIYKPRSLYD